LFVGGAQKRADGSQCDGGIRKTAQHESEASINGEMENFVIWHGEKAPDLFDAGAGDEGDAENGRVVEGGEQEVFPSQLGHREGILGVA